MGPWVVVGVFVAGMIALSRFLARRDRRGYWDEEGHGRGRPHQGVHVRRLEVPPSEPFD